MKTESKRTPTANDATGMVWWNGLTQPERKLALGNATAALGHEASVAEAWELWRKGKIALEAAAPSTSVTVDLNLDVPALDRACRQIRITRDQFVAWAVNREIELCDPESDQFEENWANGIGSDVFNATRSAGGNQ